MTEEFRSPCSDQPCLSFMKENSRKETTSGAVTVWNKTVGFFNDITVAAKKGNQSINLLNLKQKHY